MARARREPAGLAAIRSLSLLIALALMAAPAAAQSRLEYSVKANYLVRFAAFVDWPPRVFAGPQSPVVICIVGRDPFAGSLDTAARAQTAHGRPLAVRRPSTAATAGCHIVYVGQDGGAALTAAANQPGLLVVTDSAAAARARGDPFRAQRWPGAVPHRSAGGGAERAEHQFATAEPGPVSAGRLRWRGSSNCGAAVSPCWCWRR
jgi:hypothetical protein